MAEGVLRDLHDDVVGVEIDIVLVTGAALLCVSGGLAFFASAPLSGSFVLNVLPGMLLLGLGGGLASCPILLLALDGIETEDLGVASGVTNTAFTMGAALGLAILTCAAELQTAHLLRAGIGRIPALNGGYHLAFQIAACAVAIAAVIAVIATMKASGAMEREDVAREGRVA